MVIVSTGKSVNLLTQLKSAKLEGSARRLIVKVDIQSHIDGFRKRLDEGEKNPVSSHMNLLLWVMKEKIRKSENQKREQQFEVLFL